MLPPRVVVTAPAAGGLEPSSNNQQQDAEPPVARRTSFVRHPHHLQNLQHQKKAASTALALEQLRFPCRFDTTDQVLENLRRYDRCVRA